MGRPLREKYHSHKKDAARRGILFLLSFEEWLKIWIDSGRLSERGCRKGQYVMARYGDVGPYAVDNVRITTVEENSDELWARASYREKMLEVSKLKMSIEGRQKLSAAKKGTPLSLETRRKMGVSRIGNKNALGNVNFLGREHSEETKKKLREINLGKKASPEVREKMSKAQRGKSLGRVHSTETRAKISKSHVGKLLSLEHRSKIGVGLKLAAERKRKMQRRQRIKALIVSEMYTPIRRGMAT